jgi:hypothetical protein
VASAVGVPAEPQKRPQPARTQQRRLSSRVLDPTVVGVVSLVVYVVHGFNGFIDPDLGAFLYGGENVARGIPPNDGIINSDGPLADAMPGLAIWVGHAFGVDPVLAARVWFAVLSAGCCALLSMLARDAFGSRAAGFVVPGVLLLSERFLVLASNGPREKTTMVLFLLLTLVLLGRRHWWGAGACTALATLTWQPSLAPALAATIAAVLLEPAGSRLRTLGRYLFGGLVPSAATVAVFALTAALGPALDGFILVNVLYTHQPSAVAAPLATWRMLWRSYHLSLVIALVGLAVLLVTTVRAVAVARRGPPSPAVRYVVILGVGAGAATTWTAAALNGGPDLFVVLPFAALGVAALVLQVASRAPAGRNLVLGAVTLALVAGALVESVVTRDDTLVRQRADVAAVLEAVPDASVMSIEAPQVLALSQRDNLTQYQLFDRALKHLLAHRYPGGLGGYHREVRRLRPAILAVGPSSGPWLPKFLHRYYWQFGVGPGWTWYLSRSAGEAAWLQAHDANERVMAGGPTGSSRRTTTAAAP